MGNMNIHITLVTHMRTGPKKKLLSGIIAGILPASNIWVVSLFFFLFFFEANCAPSEKTVTWKVNNLACPVHKQIIKLTHYWKLSYNRAIGEQEIKSSSSHMLPLSSFERFTSIPVRQVHIQVHTPAQRIGIG